MSLPTLNLVNQFGEESINNVVGGDANIAVPIAANSILSNITGSPAAPAANTYAAVSAKLTPAMLLTGFSSGAGTVAAGDTVLQAVNKLSGNLQNKAVTANVLTGLASGAATTILSTDTILEALAKLQAQISAL